jgi:hypothetical protein
MGLINPKPSLQDQRKGGLMKSIPRIIEEQVQRWQIMQKEEKEEKEGVSIKTRHGYFPSGSYQ